MNDDNRTALPDSDQDRIFTRRFIGVALINFLTFFAFNMTTTGLPVYLSTVLGTSDIIAGLSTTLITVTAILIRPFSGIIIGHVGRKNVLIASIALIAVSMISYGVFTIVMVILIWRLINGIGWGLSTTVTHTIVADIVPKRRFAEAIGYFSLTISLAVAIAPALSVALLQHIGIIPVVVAASIATIISLVISIIMKDQEPPKSEGKKKFVLNDFIDIRALLPSGMMFMISCSYASVATFIAMHAMEVGVSNVYFYFIIYSVVTILSRPVIGRIIDRIGFFMPCILAALSVMVALMTIAFSTSVWVFCIGGIFGGLGIGTCMGAFQTMSVAAVAPERRSVATSTFLTSIDGGFGLGALIGGIIANAIGYVYMYVAVAMLPLAVAIIITILGKKKIDIYRLPDNIS